MDTPDPIDALEQHRQRVDDARRDALHAHEVAAEADRRLQDAIAELAEASADLDDPGARAWALHYLYWQVPEAKVPDLELLFGVDRGRAFERVGRGPYLGTCYRCGRPAYARSRYHVHVQGDRPRARLNRRPPVECGLCRGVDFRLLEAVVVEDEP